MRRSGSWSRFLAVARFTVRSGKRVVVTVAGFAILAAGAVMLVTPGPGILVVLAGLALLATEYAWARRALGEAKRRATDIGRTVRRRRKAPAATRSHPRGRRR
ncbi:MAG: PGPGW domain-containing protein [Acidobacteria bacterium]|nr:PGPGW domain-containing protein [Acidobacteriota bacterium]